MRLTLADEPRKVNEPHVEAALSVWRAINANPHTWARFECSVDGVYVEWGNDWGEPYGKEAPIQTVRFDLKPDGSVKTIHHTHN